MRDVAGKMFDVRGLEIHEGDTVSFVTRRGNAHPLLVGVVIGFTAKTVKILETGHTIPTNIMPHNCCVAKTEKEDTMKEM